MEISDFNPLTSEQLMEKAPSVFSDGKQQHLSERYAFVPTSDVVNFMEQNGWFPIQAVEVKTRKESNRGYQRHMVRFRHPELSFNQVEGDDNFVDILLTNSHDGKSSFTFQLGVFRLICSNGLVVKTTDMGVARVRHLLNGDEQEFNRMFTEVLNTLMNQIPKTVTSIKQMQNTEMSDQQIKEFALNAATARFQQRISKLDQQHLVKELIKAERKQDQGNNVWVVFNRLQEKLIKGNYSYSNTNNKQRKARSLSNIVQQTKLNSKLFDMAYEYVV